MSSARDSFFLDGIKAFAATLVALWILDVVVNFSIIQELYLRHPLQAGPADFLGLFLGEIQIALAVVVVCWMVAGVASQVFKPRNKTNPAVILLSSAVVTMTVFMSVRVAWEFATSNPLVAPIAGLVAGLVTWLLFQFKARDITDQGRFGEILQAVLYPAMIVGLMSQVIARVIDGRIEAAVVNAVILAILIAALVVLIVFQSGVLKFILRWLPLCVAVYFSGYVIVSGAEYGKNSDRIYKDPARKRPPIILIVLDTVRADHLKRFGYPRDTMPALEQWAENAVVATHAVSPAGWTGPAHASIFSGLPVSLHGHHYGKTEGVFSTEPVDGIAWLPGRLKNLGYHCVAVTANPLALPADDIGFNHVFQPSRRPWDRMSLAAEVDYRFSILRRLSERMRWRVPYVDAEKIVEIVERAVPKGDGPLFLFVNFLDAHSPYDPPEEALELLGVRPVQTWRRYDSHRKITVDWPNLPASKTRTLSDLYDGELRWIDMNLIHLLEWIDEQYGEKAIVIVTSDHGEELGERGRVGHEYGLPQSVAHVPLFIKGSHLEAGEFEPVMSIRSLYDYILQIATGGEPQLTTVMHPDTFGVVSERYPSGFSFKTLPGDGYDRPWVALFEDGFKAVGPSQFSFGLFDVETNGFRHEMQIDDSIANPYVDAEALREQIDRYWESYQDRREESATGATSEDVRKKLRSLGYIK
jgi:arylsulfatase A-like enzyme